MHSNARHLKILFRLIDIYDEMLLTVVEGILNVRRHDALRRPDSRYGKRGG